MFPRGTLMVWLCGSFLVGVAVASSVFYGCAAIVALLWHGWRNVFGKISLGVLVVSAILFGYLGFWRYQNVQPTYRSVRYLADERMHDLEATVLTVEEQEQSTRVVVWKVVEGEVLYEDRMLLRLPWGSSLLPGDRIAFQARCTLPEPFANVAYDAILAAKDIHVRATLQEEPLRIGSTSSLREYWHRFGEYLRHVGVSHIEQNMPSPESELLSGLLLGDAIASDAWNERFLATGTTHVVAASGSNVTLAATLVGDILFSLGIARVYAMWVIIFGIWSIAAIAGGGPPVVRAASMGTLGIIARGMGRASRAERALLFVVVLMVWCEPRILHDSAGFQLSVMSTWGLMAFGAPMQRWCSGLPERFGIREALATTLSATLATLPITLGSLQGITPWSLWVNMLILPLLPLCMLAGSITLLPFALPGVVTFPAWFVLHSVLSIIAYASSLPGALLTKEDFMTSRVVWLVISLGLLAGLLTAIKRLPSRASLALVVSPYILVGAVTFHDLVHRTVQSYDARVTIFSIGQGDAMLLQAKGNSVVIDAGPSSRIREKLGNTLPWYERTFTTAIVTHPHADHADGFPALRSRYQSQYGWWGSGQWHALASLRLLEEAWGSERVVQLGDVLTLSSSASVSILWPKMPYHQRPLSDPNDGSVIALLTTPSGSVLFLGDAGVEQEREIIPDLPPDLCAIKIGHHGSSTSTSQELLLATHPKHVVISVGEDNPFGHPHQKVLENLAQSGAKIWRTDLDGDVEILLRNGSCEVSSSW